MWGRAATLVALIATVVVALPETANAATISNASISVTPSSLLYGAVGDVTITFTMPTALPVDGRVVVTFPAPYLPTTTAATSSTIDGGLTASTVGQIVTVQRDGTGTIEPGGGVQSVTLNSVRNPTSGVDGGTFAIGWLQTRTSAGVAIDTTTPAFNPPGDTISAPGAISGFNATLPGGAVAGAVNDITLAFTTVATLPAAGRLVVTLPAGYSIGTPSVVAGGDIDGGFGSNVVGQTITFTRDGTGTPVTAGSHTLVVGGVRSPQQTGDPGVFPLFRTEAANFGVLDTVSSAAAAGDNGLLPGTLTNVSFEPATDVANAVGTMTVKFTTANPLPLLARIVVTLPTGGTFSATPTITSPDVSIDGALTAAAPVGNVVTITRGAGATVVNGDLWITISNVRNPPLATNMTWTVVTQTPTPFNPIDSGTGNRTLTIAPVALGPTLALPGSNAVNQTGSAVIGFTSPVANSGIFAGAIIEVTFPAGVTVATPLGAATVTLPAAGLVLNVTGVSGQTVTLTRTGGATLANTVVSFQLAGITNPTSAGVTGTWGLAIKDTDGVPMAGNPAVAGVTVVAGVPNPVNVEPASLVAGTTNTVNVSAQLVNPVPSLGKIVVTFPAGFVVPATPRVTPGAPEVEVTAYGLPGTFSVATSGQTVTVTRLTGGSYTSPPGGAVLFGLRNITNPTVTGSTGTYTVATQLPGGGVIDSVAATADTITAGALTNVDVEPQSLVIGGRTSVVVSFTTANPIPADGRIRVAFPTGFGFDEPGATSVISSSTIDGTFGKSVSTSTITAIRSGGTVIPAGTAVSLTITNVRLATTPTVVASTTGTYAVSTRTAASLDIDTGTAASDTYLPSALTATTVTPQSLAAGSTGTVTIAFTTTNQLPAAGQLRVALPAGTVTTSVAVQSHNLAGLLAVDPTTVGTTNLTLTRTSGSSQSGSFTVVLSGIRMPLASGTTATITVSTHNVTPFPVVDTFAAPGFALTSGVLAGADVTPSSTVAGAPISLTVTFSAPVPIAVSGAIRVTVPAGFAIDGTVLDDGTGTITGGVTVNADAFPIITVVRDGSGTELTGAVTFTLTGLRAPTTVGAAGTYAVAVLDQSLAVSQSAPAVAGDSFTGVSLSGTGGTTITEAAVVSGGATIVLTLFGDTFVAGAESTPSIRDAVVAGIDGGPTWDAAVKPALVAAEDGSPGVTRTSATVLTVVLPAVPSFDIAADDTVTVVVPAVALSGAVARTATTTIAVTATAAPATTTTTTPAPSPGGGGGGGGGGPTPSTTAPTTTTTAPDGADDDDDVEPGDDPAPLPDPEPVRQTSSGTGAFEVVGDEIVPIVPPVPTAAPVVGGAFTASGLGSWAVTADGGVFTEGDAPFLGSAGAIPLVQPIVGMAPTPSGEGYWLVAADGGIFAFGDAPFLGSTGAIVLNQPIVGMAPTPSGEGYWLIATDGGVFTFGDAPFFGSTGAIVLNEPIVGMAARPAADGYWLVAEDGGVFTFGRASFHGSTGLTGLPAPAVGIVAASDGRGYVIVDAGGRAHRFGTAVVTPNV